MSESAGQEEPGDDLAGVVPDDDVAQGIEHHDLPHIGGAHKGADHLGRGLNAVDYQAAHGEQGAQDQVVGGQDADNGTHKHAGDGHAGGGDPVSPGRDQMGEQ